MNILVSHIYGEDNSCVDKLVNMDLSISYIVWFNDFLSAVQKEKKISLLFFFWEKKISLLFLLFRKDYSEMCLVFQATDL